MKKLNVAIIGFGFMGRTHFGAWKKVPGAKVAAICDVNLKQLTTKVKGNGKDADMTTDFTGIAIHDDFDALLAGGGIDVIDLTLPTPLHPTLVAKALSAGCHVLCEKPMALNAKACDSMIAAAAGAKGKLMIAQCLRFAPATKYIHDLVVSKRYGEVVAASFDRMSMAPGWGGNKKSWFLDEKASGGMILDMHIHDADFINWTLGRPKSVNVRRHVRADGVTDRTIVIYDYGNRVVTSATSWAAAPSFVFEARFHLELEKATVIMDSKRPEPLQVYPFKGKQFCPKLDYSLSAYDAEVKAFADWVSGRMASLPLTLEDARDAVALVDAERKSMLKGRLVTL